MADGFSNKPKILRGAFVEYGLSIPPLFVVFQFNPIQLTRNRTLSYDVPGWRQNMEQAANSGTGSGIGTTAASAPPITLRKFHQEYDDLTDLRDAQVVNVTEESISFDIRLDASDKLNDGDTIAEQYGISPELSTLEQMVSPKDESLLGQAVSALLGSSSNAFSFTKSNNPPMILFIWGRKRILPVNILTMNITETEFSTDLNPIRANIAVTMNVIEGPNLPYTYSKAMKEVMSVLNLANIANITDIVIPG